MGTAGKVWEYVHKKVLKHMEKDGNINEHDRRYDGGVYELGFLCFISTHTHTLNPIPH